MAAPKHWDPQAPGSTAQQDDGPDGADYIPPGPAEVTVAFDTDGTPYLKTGA